MITMLSAKWSSGDWSRGTQVDGSEDLVTDLNVFNNPDSSDLQAGASSKRRKAKGT